MDNKLNIAICEDTKEEEDTLVSILNKSSIPNTFTVFHSGEELLDIYTPHKYDLLLMDIYMSGINGIDTVKKIREQDENVPVAFVTTSTDFTLESYRLSALKYIEKPYKEKDVNDILNLALMEKNNVPCITASKNGKDFDIRISDIMYLEINSRKLNIYINGSETVQVYKKLNDYTPELEEKGFFSPHKSYCVNLNYVKYIDDELRCFIMTDGNAIPIKRESYKKAKDAFESNLFN